MVQILERLRNERRGKSVDAAWWIHKKPLPELDLFGQPHLLPTVSEKKAESQKEPPDPNQPYFDFIRKQRPRFEEILRVVCLYYRVGSEEIFSSERTEKLVHPRQVLMYLCKELTRMSFPQIGRKMGGKHHTTVLHGWAKVKWRIGERSMPRLGITFDFDESIDADLAAEISELKSILQIKTNPA